jgi:hypothetical protein
VEEGGKTADDACEVVLVFGHEALDGRDALGPEPEEGDERHGAIVEREIVAQGRLFLAGTPGGKGDGRRIGCAAQCSKIEAQSGP